MGSGVYSSIAYSTLSDDRGYAKASRDQLFRNISVNASNTAASFNVNARSFNTQIKAEMVNVGVRDSQEHPYSTPIIIALDVTGSMMNTPYEMIKNHLPKIMDSVMQMGVRDPQLLFMAVGDHEYDRYPIQVGQNVLMCKSDEVDKVIAKAIKDNYEEPVYAETPSDASSSTTTEDKQNFY